MAPQASAVGAIVGTDVGVVVGAHVGPSVAGPPVGAAVGDAVHDVSTVEPVAVSHVSSPLSAAITVMVRGVLPLATPAVKPARAPTLIAASDSKHTRTTIDPENLFDQAEEMIGHSASG
jgi:hypothetical protein